MDQTGSTTANARALNAMLGAYAGIFTLVVLALVLLQFVIMWRIVAKAGYSGALSLLMIVPGVNLILPILFAFMEWPVERKLRAYEASASGYAPPPLNPVVPPPAIP